MVVETRTKLLHQALEKGKLLDVQTHQCVRQRKCITKKNRRAFLPQIFQNYVVYSHALGIYSQTIVNQTGTQHLSINLRLDLPQ